MNAATETRKTALMNPGRQWIRLENLVLDDELQPRAKMDWDWVHDLSGFLKDGSAFPPSTVFQLADGTLLLASGYHRWHATQKAGELTLLCDIRNGTREDAIAYAAGSNKGGGPKPMGPKDQTKAVEMLFRIDSWWDTSDQVIAEHVGCGRSKVATIRSRIVALGARKMPAKIIMRDGRHREYQKGPAGKPSISKRKGNNGGFEYYAKVNNKKIVASSIEKVEAKVAEIQREKSGRIIEDYSSSQRCLSSLGFQGGFNQQSFVYPGMKGLYRTGVVCLPCDFSTPSSLPLVIGQLVAARQRFEPGARMVVLCHVEDGSSKVIDLYLAAGFEFLTPEELAESLKNQDAKPEA